MSGIDVLVRDATTMELAAGTALLAPSLYEAGSTILLLDDGLMAGTPAEHRVFEVPFHDGTVMQHVPGWMFAKLVVEETAGIFQKTIGKNAKLMVDQAYKIDRVGIVLRDVIVTRKLDSFPDYYDIVLSMAMFGWKAAPDCPETDQFHWPVRKVSQHAGYAYEDLDKAEIASWMRTQMMLSMGFKGGL